MGKVAVRAEVERYLSTSSRRASRWCGARCWGTSASGTTVMLRERTNCQESVGAIGAHGDGFRPTCPRPTKWSP